jgi:hypothetical protein
MKHLYSSILFVFLGGMFNLFSQEETVNDASISIQFVKGNRTCSPDSTLFDIAIFTNNSTQTISGIARIDVSRKWAIISNPEVEISIQPGEQYAFPMRISLPSSLIGGNSYIVTALLETPGKTFSKNLYITVPRLSKWDLEVEESELYFNALSTDVECSFRLINRGNAEEIVRVDYSIGKLLDIPELSNNGSEIYYVVPAYSDTLIKHKVTFKKGLSDFERERYENNYRESIMAFKASASGQEVNRSIAVTKLDSRYDNHQGFDGYITPLNVEWQVFNLLTSIAPRYNLRAYGRILLPADRMLDYHIAGLALPFNDGFNQVSLARNLFFRVLYQSRNADVLMASNVGSTSLMNSYGMGIYYRQQWSKQLSSRIVLTRDRFLPIYSAAGILNYSINSFFGIRGGLGYYSDDFSQHRAYSFLAGSNFTFLDNHRFDVEGAVSFNQFDPNPELPEGDQRVGFSYKFRYNVALDKFQLAINSLNKSLNYFRNSNNFVNSVFGSYTFNPKNRLSLNFYYNSYLLDFYPFRFLKEDSWVRNTFGQFLYNRPISQKLFFNVGPEYQYIYQDIFILDENYNRTIENTFYGGYGALTYKLNDHHSISPNLRMGMAQSRFEDLRNSVFIETDLQFSMRLGLNYTGKHLRLLAFYQRGPLNISDQAFFTNDVLPTIESFQVRPYYEKYFMEKTFRLSTFLNYLYLMPSGRQLFNWNITADMYLQNGWELGISNNSFSNQYVSSEQQLITNRGINLFARVKKSFDINQPRVKFYDVTIQYFNDINGNGTKDDHEQSLPNIKAIIERNIIREDERRNQVFATRHLVSDPHGKIVLENIPAGNYMVNHTILKMNDQLFFTYGNVQEVIVNGNITVQVPLTISYKVQGKLNVDRDPNSRLGELDLTDIRISAVAEDGNTYFGLTDKYGNYTINLPPGKIYRIRVNNILGDQFTLERDEFIVELYDVKTVQVDFNFKEIRRGVKMKGENQYEFKFLNGQ